MLVQVMIKDLDKEFRIATPGTMIQLEPGIYTTRGCNTSDVTDGEELKLGCSVFGAKEGRTTIICTRPLTEEGGDVSVIRGAGNNTVANLTVDGGVPYTDQTATPYPRKRNLVFLRGGSNKIINVTGRRQYGIFDKANRRESFGLSVWSIGGVSKITGCEVVEVVGDYATAIQGNEISDCKVFFKRQAPGGPTVFRAAYNMGDTVGGFVKNCESHWAMAGVYMDWKSCVDLTISENNFIGSEVGLWINAQQTPEIIPNRVICGMRFSKNAVLLDPQADAVMGVLIDHGHSDSGLREVTQHAVRDILVEENMFDFLPGEIIKAKSRLAANVLCLTPIEKRTDELGVRNIRFVNNECNPLLTWRAKGEPGVDGYVMQKIKFEAA